MNYNALPMVDQVPSSRTPHASTILTRARAVTVNWPCVVLLAVLAFGGISPVNAQSAGEQRATREQLSSRIATLEQSLAGSSLKGSSRDRALAEIAAIRARLTEGDFKVGERFLVTLNHDGAVKSDTASVRDGLLVSLALLDAGIKDFSVKGVLRSELQERLSSHVARYLQNPAGRANVLTRVGIFGAVNQPGHYLASPDRPVSELVMLAGGPTANANLDQLEIERAGRTILKSKDSKAALRSGRTLEQLDVQSGDDVRIPAKRKINWQLVIQIFSIVSVAFFAFIQFIQWYYGRDE